MKILIQAKILIRSVSFGDFYYFLSIIPICFIKCEVDGQIPGGTLDR